MRVTVELDDDAVRAVEQLGHRRGIGVSDAVNELIRRGLVAHGQAEPFRQLTRPLGIISDVSCVTEALHLVEGDTP